MKITIDGTDNNNNKPNATTSVTAGTVDKESDLSPDTGTDKVADKKEATERKVESNLELRKMKFFDRMKAKRARIKENTKGMSFIEKLKYYVYYYKAPVITALVAIGVIISIPIIIHQNKRPVSISYAIINCSDYYNLNEAAFNDYLEFYGFDDSYQMLGNPSVYLDINTYEEDYANNPTAASFAQFPTLSYQGYYDIIITNRAGLDYCSINTIVYPLEEQLESDVYNKLIGEHRDLILDAPNYEEEYVPYAIDISATEFAKSLNTGNDEVYLCFPGKTEQNRRNSRLMINYIFNMGLE